MKNDYIYDIETYPNCFTVAFEHAYMPFKWLYEISEFKNDTEILFDFMRGLATEKARMVGFNNIGFDYPVLHLLLETHCNYETLYKKAQGIIGAQSKPETKFLHSVHPNDMFVDQVDLYKIHHFDNAARMTSLKTLEFNMRLDNIQDLPFPVGERLNQEQIKFLKKYNQHDVTATKQFYHETVPMIEFREELTTKYKKNFMNHNDTKIGKDYFQMKLKESGVELYNSDRSPKQTVREQINLRDAILPSIKFSLLAFNEVLNKLKEQTIVETKGVFKDLNCTIDGFKYVFGLGGIHGSIESQVVEADDDYIVEDWDVASYYPNLAIANKFYPEHLGETFCTIYKKLYEQRKGFAKGTAENAMLKLALNGVYGDSNSKFSVFYDPLFTMSITLNGQLLLCRLAEMLMAANVQMVQINTDGLTIRYKRECKQLVHDICHQWEKETGLTLESALYSRMFIRDVNNYIAEYEAGGVKRKGAYEYDLQWYQNGSQLVVPKVAEDILLHGGSIREKIKNHTDKMDFLLRAKVPRSSKLFYGDEQVQNTSRYYVSNQGEKLIKKMPPLKGKTDWREFNQCKNHVVTLRNIVNDDITGIDYDYYVKEVEKLVVGF